MTLQQLELATRTGVRPQGSAPEGTAPERAVERLVEEIQDDARRREAAEIEKLRQRLFDLD